MHPPERIVGVEKAVGIKIETTGAGVLEIGLPVRIAPLLTPPEIVTAVVAEAVGGVDGAEGYRIRSTPHAPQARENLLKPHPLLRMSGNS